MAHGVSKGQLDSNFSSRIDGLETSAKKQSEMFQSMDTFRPWHTPTELNGRDLLDVPALHNPCWNRNNINSLYSEQILAGPGKKGGTSGDLIAMKWQADFMAAEERAFRLRHASLPRCAALMHGRLDGHSRSGVSVFSFLKQGVQNYIDVGRSHGTGS